MLSTMGQCPAGAKPRACEGPRRLRRHTCGRNGDSQRVSCYPPGWTVGRRDRPRIGAVCPLVRLVSGGGDHVTGDRPRPDPVWETARFSVTPAPTAVLHLCSPAGGCHDTPQRLFSSPSSPHSSSPAAASAHWPTPGL